MRTQEPSEAYIRRSKDPSNRIHCDFCASCFMYKCDGSTAMHNDLHLTVVGWFKKEPDGEAHKNS